MIGDTGCCGFSGMSKGPNVFGLMTLSVPMLVAVAAVYPIILLLATVIPGMRTLRHQMRIIIRANYNLIHQKAFFPLFRCKVAGSVFGVSPRLSGFLYRSFNLTIFLLIWICILMPVWMWVA